MAGDFQKNWTPKTLEECIEPGYTATRLHLWSGIIRKIGWIIFWILIAIGGILTIAETVIMADVDEDMAWYTFLTMAVKWGFIVVVEYFVFQIISLHINAMAVIAHNTMISANVAVLEYKISNSSFSVSGSEKNSNHSSFLNSGKNKSTEAKGWKCTCGRENAIYVSTCVCGKSAREIRMNQSAENTN